MSDLRKRIRSFAELESDWDGYGAVPTTDESIGKALSILFYVEREAGITVPVDAVPTPEGGLLVEWKARDERLQIHIHPDLAVTGIRVFVQNGKKGRRTITPCSIPQIINLVKSMAEMAEMAEAMTA